MSLFSAGLKFNKINNINKDMYIDCLGKSFDIIPSDLYPSVLLSHGNILDIRYSKVGDVFFVKDLFNGETVFYPPVGNINDMLSAMEKYIRKGNVFTAVPEDMKDVLQNHFGESVAFTEEPWLFDYIIDNKELSDCSGVKYKSIRQARNRFFENNDVIVKDIKDCNLSDIHKLNNKAIKDMNEKYPDNAGVDHEKIIFEYLLEMLHEGNSGLFGTVLTINSVPVAFTINERIGDTSVGIYAKSDHSYKDIGPALAVSDAENQLSLGIKYCNLMADEGEPGLKENKTLLRPCKILKKYRCEFL